MMLSHPLTAQAYSHGWTNRIRETTITKSKEKQTTKWKYIFGFHILYKQRRGTHTHTYNMHKAPSFTCIGVHLYRNWWLQNSSGHWQYALERDMHTGKKDMYTSKMIIFIRSVYMFIVGSQIRESIRSVRVYVFVSVCKSVSVCVLLCVIEVWRLNHSVCAEMIAYKKSRDPQRHQSLHE